MSKSAFSAKVFANYVFIVGTVLVIAPNLLLSTFGHRQNITNYYKGS
jgi:hypothetical protein